MPKFHSVMNPAGNAANGMNPSLLHKKRLPQEATIYLHLAYTMYFRTMGDLNKNYDHCKRLIQIIESAPSQLIERQKQYWGGLINMSIALTELRRFKEAYTLADKIRAIPAKNEHISFYVFYFSYGLAFDILHITYQFAKAVELVKEVEAGLSRFKGQISSDRYMTFCYQIAYSYFGNENYSNAIVWSNKIINNPETDQRMDLRSAARLLNLMAHIEKRNWNFAGHYLDKSINKFLEKNKRMYRFENMLLQFVNKKLSGLPAETSAQTLSDVFKEFKPQAEKILKNPFESKFLNYIDFPSWIESKIQNRPFAEIVMRKTK